tara:strand:- start:607 stop:1200 length:594 start_codon:yes stop_codon:yes gene_type:complete
MLNYKKMRKIIFLIIIFLSLAFTIGINNTSIIISPKSQLVIKGTTNVSKFKCHFNIEEIKNPIPVSYVQKEEKFVFEKALLVLDNSCFDCGSSAINKDFVNLLKSDEYPQIVLELKEIQKDTKVTNVVHALIEIFIAGESKLYVIPVKIEGDSILNVSGSLSLNICDFNLEAPKKALGLIVVSEIININFDLLIQEK